MTILLALSSFLILFTLYAAYAGYAYRRVMPQSRPCVDCSVPRQVNGFDLYYRELGEQKSAPPVILVHGGPGHSSLSFKDGFDFLAEQTRVIFYDQRGSGNSQIKPADGDYTIENLIDELDALRSNIVGAEKVVLIGHSFGSALVQRYALRYPEHVAKMVIVSGIRINNGMKSRLLWKWLGGFFYSLALGIPPGDSKAADNWFSESSDRDNLKRLFDKSKAALLGGMGPLSFAVWRDISFSLISSDYKDELNQLSVPTLFLYGAADLPYTGKPVADELCSLLPNCQSVEFMRSGHWPYLEEPEKFQKVMMDFLFTISPASSGQSK